MEESWGKGEIKDRARLAMVYRRTGRERQRRKTPLVVGLLYEVGGDVSPGVKTGN